MAHAGDPPDIDWLLIDRYLAGTASDADTAAVEQWIASDGAHGVLVSHLQAARERWEPERPTAWNTVRMWDRVERVLRDDARRHFPARAWPSVGRDTWRGWVVWSASLAVVCVALTVGVRLSPLLGRRPLRIASTARVFVTRAGERARAELADGTQLYIGPATRVAIPTSFGSTRRDVYVDGEAYFVVRHDPTRPFAVHMRGVNTEDVGTAFVVRAYASDPSVRVSVVEGAVRVTQDGVGGGGVDLRRADVALVAADGRTTVDHHGDIGTALAWTEGRLMFDDMVAADVLQELSRWYGVEIRVTDPAVARGRITASFATPSAAEAVSRLARLLGGHAEWHGPVVTIMTGTRGNR